MGISNFKRIETGPAFVDVNTSLITVSRTVVSTDAGDLLLVGNTSASGSVTITLPTNANAPIPIGLTITIVQMGDKPVIIAPATGVSIVRETGGVAGATTTSTSTPNVIQTRKRYSRIQLVKTGVDTWLSDGYGIFVQDPATSTPLNPQVGDLWAW